MNIEVSEEKILDETIKFVKEKLHGAESGHDWFHIERVWKNSLTIAKGEIENGKKLNLFVIQIAALLHDIADHKFNNGDEFAGSRVARQFLTNLDCNSEDIELICSIILKISFKGSSEKNEIDTIEGMIVQDADRLDAIGAIGVGRAFSYGGFRKRQMYDPDDPPKKNMTWEQYKSNTGSTINHFFEKLLLLKDMMNTDTGKKLAEARHEYMVGFIEKFLSEWNAIS